MKSYAVEVQTSSCAPTDWTSNALRFATQPEAEAYAVDLFHRWLAVTRWRVVESEDAPNQGVEPGSQFMRRIMTNMPHTEGDDEMFECRLSCGADAHLFFANMLRGMTGYVVSIRAVAMGDQYHDYRIVEVKHLQDEPCVILVPWEEGNDAREYPQIALSIFDITGLHVY